MHRSVNMSPQIKITRVDLGATACSACDVANWLDNPMTLLYGQEA